jgi:hypothetical protein
MFVESPNIQSGLWFPIFLILYLTGRTSIVIKRFGCLELGIRDPYMSPIRSLELQLYHATVGTLSNDVIVNSGSVNSFTVPRGYCGEIRVKRPFKISCANRG